MVDVRAAGEGQEGVSGSLQAHVSAAGRFQPAPGGEPCCSLNAQLLRSVLEAGLKVMSLPQALLQLP